MSDPVRCAVIGAGHIGRFHADKYARHPSARLVAVVDPSPERAQAVARQHGAEPRAEFAGLVGRVDAVSICAPTPAHYAIARDCIAAGIHVLVEKPIAVTLAEADAMVAAAAAAGTVLQVGHLERFSMAGLGVAAVLDRPAFVDARRLTAFRGRGADVSVVLDLMIHDIDLVAAIAGSPVASVAAVGRRVVSETEDVAAAQLRFQDGTAATLVASRVSPQAERSLRILQASGEIAIDLQARRLTATRASVPGDAPTTIEASQPDADPLGAQIDAFLGCIAGGGRPLVDGTAGRDALATALAVIRSIRSDGAAVPIEKSHA
ncbi:Gfo/Idh/MocA family oxidoreductase [Stella sp.]|uniref:Gfo/Idh/MocA family oxidoreductase n=1 Tax=Stella sp. TaxID=2912054 RepID=UPI0035B39CB1